MPDTSTDLLLECLVEALQTFAFIGAEPPPEHVAAPAAADLYTLPFTGPAPGRLQLAAPRGLGCLMAANLLGLDPAEPQAGERAADVMGELCNIMAGLWLRTLPTGESAEMGLPSSVALENWDELASRPGSVVVLADGFPLIARVEETS